MGLFPSIAVFFVIWWLCLFVVLPFGVRSQHEMNEVVAPGTDAGAPHRPYLIRKALVTTILAAIIFAGVHVYFNVYHFSLETLIR
jgi:predicted secreted protein